MALEEESPLLNVDEFSERILNTLVEEPDSRDKLKEIAKEYTEESVEDSLRLKVLSNPIPKHVALIADGNRRYAKKMGINNFVGHILGAIRSLLIVTSLMDLGVKEVTFYAFSVENFKRKDKEVDFIMNLFAHTFELLPKLATIRERKIRVQVVGDLSLIPERLVRAISLVEDETSAYDNCILTFCLGYGSRHQLTLSCRSIAKKVKEGHIEPDDVNESTFEDNLYGDKHKISYPELIIRTSGEKRLSNFLLWEGAYSELYFSRLLFPEFNKNSLYKAIIDLQKRERRFGE